MTQAERPVFPAVEKTVRVVEHSAAVRAGFREKVERLAVGRLATVRQTEFAPRVAVRTVAADRVKAVPAAADPARRSERIAEP